MQVIACETAAEFQATLRITNDLWGGQPAWDRGFRGHGNADWPLLPTALRPGTSLSFANTEVTAPLDNIGEQHWREYKLIQL